MGSPNSSQAEPSRLRRFLNPGLVVLAVGLVLLGVTVWQVQSSRDFVASAERADGRVVDLVLQRGTSSDDDDTYAPRVEFTTADGETITFLSSTGSSPPGHSVGEQVEVLYQAEDPTDAMIDSWGDRWGTSLILGLFGVLLTLFGGLFYGAMVRPSPKQTPNVDGDSNQSTQMTPDQYVIEPTISGADDEDERLSGER